MGGYGNLGIDIVGSCVGECSIILREKIELQSGGMETSSEKK